MFKPSALTPASCCRFVPGQRPPGVPQHRYPEQHHVQGMPNRLPQWEAWAWHGMGGSYAEDSPCARTRPSLAAPPLLRPAPAHAPAGAINAGLDMSGVTDRQPKNERM